MRVWIINYYTGVPDKSSNPRYVQFARYFMGKEWQVITFNANHFGDERTPLFERKCMVIMILFTSKLLVMQVIV